MLVIFADATSGPGTWLRWLPVCVSVSSGHEAGVSDCSKTHILT